MVTAIANYSPLFVIVVVLGITITLTNAKRFLHLYFFLFLSLLFYAFIEYRFSIVQARYAVALMPILAVFGSEAICGIASRLASPNTLLIRGISLRIFTYASMMSVILLSSMLGFGVLTQSTAILKGPFNVKNWSRAESWISTNTDESDTIMAMWPVPLFYSDRRTITLLTLEEYSDSDLFAILDQGRVSYLVIDHDMRYRITSPVLADLYDRVEDREHFNVVYQIGSNGWEDPLLVIYQVSLS
jgi:hypothetical protein